VADRRGFEFLSGAVGVAVPCSFGNRLPGAVVASVLAARGLRPTSLGFLTSKSCWQLFATSHPELALQLRS
jgi:hypothetical protein